MKQSTATKTRKELENKMAKVFAAEIESLPAEFRGIMVDDLVSAFESRLAVFSRMQLNLDFLSVIKGEVHVETQ